MTEKDLWDFITFKMNIISIRKYTADTDVVNEVTYMRQSVMACVVIQFLLHDVNHWITATSYDKISKLSLFKFQ